MHKLSIYMAKNSNLHAAKTNKKDEFYTQMPDIANELRHYKQHFAGKTVFCNCDDPYESNFFKFFALNFNTWGLKKLIATCYNGSPVQGNELLLSFDFGDDAPKPKKVAHKIEITEIPDANGDDAIDLTDVQFLLQNDKNVISVLKDNGSFNSDESKKLLEEADIVVTNPPFSLFREYVAQLVQYKKHFIILGNMNAVTYKEIFPLIKDNQMWFGPSISSGDREFQVPEDYPLTAASSRIDEEGRRFVRVKGVRWFTNLEHKKRHETLDLYKSYSPEEYPHYDNYDAINVDKTADIPMDYDGIMGVPITFLDKYNPDQFEIIKFRKGNDDKDLSINGSCPYFRILIRKKQ